MKSPVIAGPEDETEADEEDEEDEDVEEAEAEEEEGVVVVVSVERGLRTLGLGCQVAENKQRPVRPTSIVSSKSTSRFWALMIHFPCITHLFLVFHSS